jgi:DNA (cytosine-5)-methyltransferase 1
MPRYPFEFVQADVLALDPEWVAGFDAIHASPPCQGYSITAKLHPEKEYPDLIPQTRDILQASGRPWVMENVVGAPLINPIMLCGTMFGLQVFRHRLFETSFWIMPPVHTPHAGTTNSSRSYSRFSTGSDMICVAGHNFRRADGAVAMDIDWPCTREEMSQAIPPAYTEWLGRQMLHCADFRRDAA